jgi:hypothetical protein
LCPRCMFDHHASSVREGNVSCLGMFRSHTTMMGAPIRAGGARSPLGSLGTVEHPIDQVLKFGLSSRAFAHEFV